MTRDAHQKVTSAHLRRDAYLYVRQSTLRQVFENTESTKRQYALRERAVALGWPMERVVVIDSDLGQSGASAADREGFQKLVAEVGLGHVGIVLGLEVSRLARSSTDWHRLLEICALTDTLILDEDGVYDPSHFNDRLLLGLKGTMSEAELHVLKARLQGGILSKARRGELQGPLPVGLAYDPIGRVVLDPDQQVQQALRIFFDTFRCTGSALATVKSFARQGLQFPQRIRTGAHKGELVWAPLLHSRVRQVLHNPRYAGAFFYGRTHTRHTADGKTRVDRLPRDEWFSLVRDAHPGYITWEEFEGNQRRLLENAQAHGSDRRKSPPREGPALLQGLVLCGVCGNRMSVRYHSHGGRLVPDYMCQKRGIEHGTPLCQVIQGARLDEALGELLVEAVTPVAIQEALAVHQELLGRMEEADRLRRQQVERARYEADLAQRRYLRVDPDNRLVANTLEADWNEKLRALAAAQEDYERHRAQDQLVLDEKRQAEILSLASDFRRLWQSPQTPHRERKRLARLVLEDVTLIRGEEITAHVRFKGGATRTLAVPLSLTSWEMRQTDAQVVQEIDRLLDEHTEGEIAALLNAKGLKSGEGKPFHRRMVQRLRQDYGLTERLTRLRAAGMLTQEEMAAALGVCIATIKKWRRRGILRAHAYTDKHDYLYEPPGVDAPAKWKHKTVRLTPTGESERGAV